MIQGVRGVIGGGADAGRRPGPRESTRGGGGDKKVSSMIQGVRGGGDRRRNRLTANDQRHTWANREVLTMDLLYDNSKIFMARYIHAVHTYKHKAGKQRSSVRG